LQELEGLTVKHNLNPIYGDTDSIFIIADESKVSALETEWSNAHPDITIDRKGIYSKMLRGKKKHYLLIPRDYPSFRQ
jgi:DNA polymerase elongation subunit (family B)